MKIEHKGLKAVDRLYGSIVSDVLREGKKRLSRNGPTIQIPAIGCALEIAKVEDAIIEMRKMFTKGIEGEFKTLIDPTPLTNVKQFEANGCNYWKPWAGPNGELNLDYHNRLHPAWEETVETLKEDPYDRRLVVSLWSNTIEERSKLSLPSCWYNLQFVTEPTDIIGEFNLSLIWTQRSVDVAVGLPSDMYLAALFLKEMAKQASSDEPGGYTYNIDTIYFNLANVHIYKEHKEKLIGMLKNPNKNRVIKFEIKE